MFYFHLFYMSSPTLFLSPWKRCKLCEDISFKNPQDFKLHVRNSHCKKEGGSYVCCYGKNNVCRSLPVEGVSELDYNLHVNKQHVHACPGDERKAEEEDDEFMQSLSQKFSHILSADMANSKPNVIVEEYKWTVFDSSQNLPAVLNDPRRTKREWDLFTKAWGDGFTENVTISPNPHLPSITLANFESYLKHIKSHLQKKRSSLRRHSKAKLENVAQLFPSTSVELIPELEDVPKIFMQAEFNLEDPELFNQILPLAELYDNKDQRDMPKNSVKLLQEKMSHYLDAVEVQIAKQISTRSEAFLQAMTSHDALMIELTHVIKCVCDLREKIHVMKQVNVEAPMQVIRLKRQQGNYMQLYKFLKHIATVHQTQSTIQSLLGTSDFVGALDLIYTTQEVLIQELAGVHSFRHLSSQLSEMEKVIGRMMETDFVRYIAADLNRPFDCEENIAEKDCLIAILFGMLRQRNDNVVEIFKEECYTAINATVKQSVIEVVSQADDFDEENSSINFLDQLSSLSSSKWLDLMNLILRNVKYLLQRIQALYLVMCETTDIAAGVSPNTSSQDSPYQVLPLMENEGDLRIPREHYEKLKTHLKNFICSICDNAHECCAKVFNAKTKDGSLDKLSVSSFIQLARDIKAFQEFSESLSGKQSMSLQLALQNQATKFTTKFHEQRKSKLLLLIESEQWKQADVPMEFQDIVNHILSTGSITFPPKRVDGDKKVQHPAQPYILVHNEPYMVVGTLLMLLKMVVEYCYCIAELPMLATDLVSRVIEIMKIFNVKTYQLVLGAEAVTTVGLKTITVKHITLASRCLKFISYFLPQIKNRFLSSMPPKQQYVTKHFDTLLNDYQEHIISLNRKLESIINDMFEFQLLQWEVKAPVPSPCFMTILKHVNKFHKSISEILPENEVQDIFVKVNYIFKLKIKTHLTKLQANSDAGLQKGLITQELSYYIQNLRKLKLDIDVNINDLWENR